MTREELLKLAADPDKTPFDYVVVGSGAGGGPLAARLALNHQRVLVLEAGVDPGEFDPPRPAPPQGQPVRLREVYEMPGYHAAATEDPPISWDFSVRHYDDDVQQAADRKYDASKDPSKNGGKGKGGIQYPRAAALGGCTSHHAMIIIRPNDRDWDRLAEYTNDSSWRSENMQGYFAKIENCLYYAVYRGYLGRILGGILWAIQWIATQLNPKRQLDPGGHGSAGWQKTSFIDPLVIAGIVKTDRTFLGVLKDVLFSALRTKDERSILVRALAHLQILQFLDPNVRSPEIPTRDHLSLISIGTDGERRMGVREHLDDVKTRHPDRLVIETAVHATRVIFDDDKAGSTPRAIGVEVMEGKYLYRASPRTAESPATPPRKQYFARREVILCGGSFNTPQMLMLSGIGDPAHLAEHGITGLRDRDGQVIAPPVALGGVGQNLQDRYEVSVISEAKREFSTLKGLTFTPDDASDPARKRWFENGKGLYATNGGALALMMSSEANRLVRPDPDLFIFGVPAAFRGYYWKWSKQLLSRVKDAPPVSRNLWTWVILKAYTRNNAGTVRLRTGDPRDPPDINFHSFMEGPPEHRHDVKALCEAVRKVRAINGTIGAFTNEIQPGAGIATGSADLERWVQDEAWGHHACGTCRIGPDPWQANVGDLTDANAVIDSKFRVHGVRNLRVVDASIFPEIPGYFIVTPVFMIAEKAADTLLADSEKYPSALERLEAGAIGARRAVANTAPPAAEPLSKLPDDTVGLALSGGGIRSATFCLGILQSLAMRDRLRRFDYVASVSGGGYIASFLGRLYSRISGRVQDRAQRVREILSRVDSPEIWWLRRHANYIASAGHEDLTTNLAVFSRNLVFVHLCVGALVFGIFGVARLLAITHADANPAIWEIAGFTVSFWWWIPWGILFGAVLPLALGFWLAPIPRRGSPYSVLVLLTWLAVLVSGIYALSMPGLQLVGAIIVLVLSLGWLAQEVARGGIAPDPKPAKVAWGTPDEPEQAVEPGVTPVSLGLTVRNRLTRGLGAALLALVASIAWVVLDTLAQRASGPTMMPYTGAAMIIVALLLPLLRRGATGMAANGSRDPMAGAVQWKRQALIRAAAIGLAGVLLFFIDVLAHFIFKHEEIGVWAVVTALAGSALIGRALPFLNLSSLQQAYSEKLVRTFLGASTPTRVHPTGTDTPTAVEVPDPNDDVVLGDYHPELHGGPLHLMSVCVNDTVDLVSGRQLRADKGLPMCLGPAGVSVGLRYHARWVPARPEEKGRTDSRIQISPLPVAPDPNRFHVFVRKDREPTWVEQLRLGQWMAISGASFTTGAGRHTNIAQSLLLGLLNVRLGYWWDSGIGPSDRPGRYPPNIWRWLKAFPADVLFRVQATLLNEWRAYFPGPSARLWYLSDGGHFDNTALYELLRRRIPFIVAIDAAEDQLYQMDDLSILTRQVRLDFGATFAWIDPTDARGSGGSAWNAIDAATNVIVPRSTVPNWIRAYFDPDSVGPVTELRKDGGSYSALARVTYADAPGVETWVLLVKSCLPAGVPTDVRNYAMTHPSFPNEPTLNQFFDDAQWESYRQLGQSIGNSVFR